MCVKNKSSVPSTRSPTARLLIPWVVYVHALLRSLDVSVTRSMIALHVLPGASKRLSQQSLGALLGFVIASLLVCVVGDRGIEDNNGFAAIAIYISGGFSRIPLTSSDSNILDMEIP
ncbi:unnamed protein product [Rhizoctonia solani]|uniref:Uncharacterized protein n=1 Tax=Rhizoctonia solani TaxID=456999 RepID=A0A8H3B4I5_9AGAM|nr:unnamed protein product [Rhizoctonia solani]